MLLRDGNAELLMLRDVAVLLCWALMVVCALWMGAGAFLGTAWRMSKFEAGVRGRGGKFRPLYGPVWERYGHLLWYGLLGFPAFLGSIALLDLLGEVG